MIHQFILAAPRPGRTAAEFQDYWVRVHAVRYARLIPQIRRYLIDTRVPFDGDRGDPPLPHQGIAEIWLDDEAAQVASLQSDEYLHGARPDEPNWAAFWLTLVIDTTASDLVPEPAPQPAVKLTTLLKRRPGVSLAAYREQTLRDYAPLASALPGVRQHLHCHTRDSGYVFGEARFDSVEQLWFDDLDALRHALNSPHHTDVVEPARAALVDPRYVFTLTATEHPIPLPTHDQGVPQVVRAT